MGVEPGQQCDHVLVEIGRHRVCRDCAAVYAAIAGPRELVLLGQYAAVVALLDETARLAALEAVVAAAALALAEGCISDCTCGSACGLLLPILGVSEDQHWQTMQKLIERHRAAKGWPAWGRGTPDGDV